MKAAEITSSKTLVAWHDISNNFDRVFSFESREDAITFCWLEEEFFDDSHYYGAPVTKILNKKDIVLIATKSNLKFSFPKISAPANCFRNVKFKHQFNDWWKINRYKYSTNCDNLFEFLNSQQ